MPGQAGSGSITIVIPGGLCTTETIIEHENFSRGTVLAISYRANQNNIYRAGIMEGVGLTSWGVLTGTAV